MIHMREFNEFEIRNIKYLTQKNIEYFRPTIVEHTKNLPKRRLGTAPCTLNVV